MKEFFKNLKFKLFPATLPEKHITAIVVSYNNSKWYKKNLDSIFNQKYSNFDVIYVDDCSPDGTADLAESYVNKLGQSSKFKLIRNKANAGSMANKYTASHMAADKSIVVLVDGDDWLAHNKVFKYINKVYSTTNCWMTYGQFVRYPTGKKGHCKKLSHSENFRALDQTYVSHLRTYYAKLFKLVKKEDLMKDGQFVPVSEDVAGSLPMLEMARGHIRFISKILYVYNQAHEFNDFKKFPKEQVDIVNYIKSKKPYQPISQIGID